MTNTPVTDMAPMDAAKLKGMIEKYSADRAMALATANVRMKPNRRVKSEAEPLVPLIPAEVDAQRRAIGAEIDRLYAVVNNVYPKEMFERFCEVTEKLVKQMQGIFIESLAHGADGPGVKETAELFCKYNQSVYELNAFAEKRKTLPWAGLATLMGLGSVLMASYLVNRKKP